MCIAEMFKDFHDNFLADCEDMGMMIIEYPIVETPVVHFPPRSFRILHSTSHHIQNGIYSSAEFDCQSSVSSADQEYGR